ncbi:MAG: PrsW family intramembrane metalloprotease [Thermoanaerobaculales bacterium]|nr:PrsW family intramembrane metalloprotease [Thermoanaerobaculales bacterium]
MSLFELAALAAALGSSTVLLGAVVSFVWWFDRYDREPLHLVAGVFLWGALAAPVFSATGCSALGLGLSLEHLTLAGWVGPVLEEATKAFGVVLVVVLSREFDNPTDGVVYGTACGLGFAATENLCYAVSGADDFTINGALGVLIARTAMAAGIHAVSSAAFGGCLGFATLSARHWTRAAWVAGGLALAAGVHAGWNLMLLHLEPSGGVLLLVVPLLYLVYLLTLVGFVRSEQRILVRELAEEVELETLPPWVKDVIPYYRRRVRSGWWPHRRERTVLARLLTRLAFRKHALRRLPEQDAGLAGLEVVRLRQRVRAMLGVGEAST